MRQLTFALRTDGAPIALAESLRRAVREIDPALPVSPIRTFEDGVAQTLAQRRFTSVLLTMFAGFGLGLGVLGVYGVLACTVAERRQEIGLRRALGAPGARVLLLVLSQGLTPVVVGILVGIGATLSARSVLGDPALRHLADRCPNVCARRRERPDRGRSRVPHPRPPRVASQSARGFARHVGQSDDNAGTRGDCQHIPQKGGEAAPRCLFLDAPEHRSTIGTTVDPPDLDLVSGDFPRERVRLIVDRRLERKKSVLHTFPSE